MALPDARGDKGIVAKKFIRQEHLIAKVEQSVPREDGAVRTICGGEFAMLLAEPLECIRMRADLSTNLLVINGLTP